LTKQKAARDLIDDELAIRILNALSARDLTHNEAIALGESALHVGSVLTSLQAIGLIEASCGPCQPSTCSYKLAEKGKDVLGKLR
jgi:DNA-binding HxlR family transcriptional regulator